MTCFTPCHAFTIGTEGDDGKRISRAAYIEMWKHEAMLQMSEHGIPASITLAQAILESGDGNSRLAREANNHFGIKCHDWQGKKIYHDDDARKECFRKYNNARESFEDHSVFLKRSRYLFLYELKPTDYEGWAKGLKKAGYATNPKYPELLIRIIEENQLSKYDTAKPGSKPIAKPEKAKPTKNRGNSGEIIIDISQAHAVEKSDNNINYITVPQATTVDQLARAMQVGPWQIAKYNDLSKNEAIPAGTKIYLQPKRNKSQKYATHTVVTGETLHSISQKYGVKQDRILKYSNLPESYRPRPGDVLKLRK